MHDLIILHDTVQSGGGVKTSVTPQVRRGERSVECICMGAVDVHMHGAVDVHMHECSSPSPSLGNLHLLLHGEYGMNCLSHAPQRPSRDRLQLCPQQLEFGVWLCTVN